MSRSLFVPITIVTFFVFFVITSVLVSLLVVGNEPQETTSSATTAVVLTPALGVDAQGVSVALPLFQALVSHGFHAKIVYADASNFSTVIETLHISDGIEYVITTAGTDEIVQALPVLRRHEQDLMIFSLCSTGDALAEVPNVVRFLTSDANAFYYIVFSLATAAAGARDWMVLYDANDTWSRDLAARLEYVPTLLNVTLHAYTLDDYDAFVARGVRMRNETLAVVLTLEQMLASESVVCALPETPTVLTVTSFYALGESYWTCVSGRGAPVYGFGSFWSLSDYPMLSTVYDGRRFDPYLLGAASAFFWTGHGQFVRREQNLSPLALFQAMQDVQGRFTTVGEYRVAQVMLTKAYGETRSFVPEAIFANYQDMSVPGVSISSGRRLLVSKHEERAILHTTVKVVTLDSSGIAKWIRSW